MNKGKESRKDKNVRNDRKTGWALEQIAIIRLILLLLLLFLFFAILNSILDLEVNLVDFRCFNHDNSQQALLKCLFMLLCLCIYFP